MGSKARRTGGNAGRKGARRLVTGLLIASPLAWASTAHAATITANFSRGAIAEYTNNPNGTDKGVLFSTLGISSMSISQVSANGQWGGSQGNDTAVTATINFTNGTSASFPAAINWVKNAGSGQFDWIGITIGSATTVNDGYTLDSGFQKTYVLEFPQSSVTLSTLLPNGLDGSANTGQALSALNQYFPSATPPVITGPSGGAGAASSAISVNENQTAVTTLTADKTVNWSITGGTDSSKFTISSSGVISFSAAPDFEAPTDSDTNNSYALTVTATDSNGNTSTQTITVTVLDLDDIAPVIASGQSFSYAENRSAGATVGTVAATDAAGVTGFRFSATGTQTSADGYYTIDNSGVLRITAAGAAAGVASNDYEVAPNSFTYGVQAGDSAGNWSAATNVTLNVTDADDTAPTVSAGQSFFYAENRSANTSVGTVSGSDAMGVTQFRFAATGTQTSADGYYTIDNSGVLRIAAAGTAAGVANNDYEVAPNSFTYQVQAGDAAGNWSAATAITLQVTDLPDTAPVITGPSGGAGAFSSSISVNENQTGVTTLTADKAVSWAVTGGADAGRFSISSAGALTFNAAPDYEAPADSDTDNNYVLTVTATDANGNIATQSVTVTVLDLDDSAPVIAAGQTFSYAENQSAGATVATVSATDAAGVTGFRFSATGTQTSADGYYSIDNSGVMRITAAGAAAGVASNDYETAPNSFTHALQAGDSAGNWSAATDVTFNVTDLADTPPAITGPSGGPGAAASSMSVNEGTTTVTSLTSSVPVTWSLVGGNDQGRFQISPSGAITFAAAPDYESPTDSDTNNSYVLTVQATDSNGNSSTQTVTVTVLDLPDTPPAITGPSGGAGAASSSVSVNEGQTAVTTLTSNLPVSWSIVGGNDQGRFQISPSGAITFVAAPDYEAPTDSDTNNSYALVVQATDANGNVSTQTVTVTVLDLPDTPPAITGPSGGPGAAASSISVNEGTTSVTTLASSVPVTWSIVGGNDQGRFQVSPSGAITFVAAPDYEAPTDSDTNNSYVLTVEAIDANGNSSTQTVTVAVLDLADTPPAITGPSGGAGAASSSISVNEGSTSVTSLTSSVPVTWSIVGGNDQGRFQISPGGTITFTAAPDYESPTDSDTNNTYVLTAQATDSNGNSSTQTITVTVLDVPDTPPAITGPSGSPGAATSLISVNEGQTAVTTLTSSVPVTWSIVGGNDQGRFQISPSGAISFVGAPDYANPTDSDNNNSYILTAQATDANGNSSTQTVTVTVLDVAEPGPAITGPSGGPGAAASSVSVNEGTAAVTTLTSNLPVIWSIVGGNDQGRFQISPSGAISFVGAPDYETPTDSDTDNSYVLTVQAIDANGNSSTQTVTVTVLDLPDTPPAITGPSGGAGAATSSISVNEGTDVVTTLASNAPVTWTVTGGADASKFAISPAGQISFIGAPVYANPTDSDANNIYVLKVSAADGNGNVSAQTITVTVLNVDGTAPVVGAAQTFSYAENRAASAVVATVAASDAVGVTAFRFASTGTQTSADGYYSIDNAGLVRITAAGAAAGVANNDFEVAPNSFTYAVEAGDAAGNWSASANVILNVTDLADTAPVITGPSGGPGATTSAISINEGTTAVTTLGSNAPVTWSIIGGNDQGQFQVTTDGAILFLAAPDYESPSDSDRNNIYVLTVQATDAGGNKSAQTISVTVLNVDELQRKLNEIGSRLRQNLRDHAFGSLSSMLSFNEGLIGITDPVCSADRGKPLSGRVNADENRQDAGLNFRRDLTSCRSRTRLFVDGGVGFTRVHRNWTARGLASLRIEQVVGTNVVLGAALLGSTASDELQAFADSRISDRSLQLNLYARTQLSDRLRLGAFAGWGRAHYSLRLKDEGLDLRGEMDGTRYLYGAALSGDIPLGALKLTTDAILSRAVERLHSASLEASYAGESRSDIAFPVGTVDITRLSIPVHIPILFGEGRDDENGTRLDISPGMLCEDSSADSSSLHCGYQLGLKFRMSPTGRTGIHGEARQELVDGQALRLLSLGFMRMFGPADRYAVAVDAERRAGPRGRDDRLMLHIGRR